MATIYKVELDSSSSDFFIRYTLNGTEYQVRFRYNNRLSRWVMGLSDSNGNSLIEGHTVLNEKDMFGSYLTLYPTVPFDALMFKDNTGIAAPTRESLGSTSVMYRVTA